MSEDRRIEGLRVRRHERRDCALPAEVLVASASAGAVSLSRAAAGASGGAEIQIVDFSPGGLGLSGPVYFPRGCCLIVRVPAEEGGGGHPVEVLCRVRRARMADRMPSYLLGVSFEVGREERDAFLRELEARVRARDGVRTQARAA